MRAAEPLPPADAAIKAIREGLIRYFVEEDGPDRQRVRELRRRIADRIEVDLALLDALDPAPETEPSLGATETLALNGLDAAELKARKRHDWDDQTYWGRSSSTDGERDAGEEPEDENEHGGDIQYESHDPQPGDTTQWMHGYDPRVADGARAALQQVQVNQFSPEPAAGIDRDDDYRSDTTPGWVAPVDPADVLAVSVYDQPLALRVLHPRQRSVGSERVKLLRRVHRALPVARAEIPNSML